MFLLSAYDGLPFSDQVMHGVHFVLCCFAVAVACVPLLTENSDTEYKLGGFFYVPLSIAAFLSACVIAWVEQSLLLLCFNAFCAYLLLSGWRAVHAKERPSLIDWALPAGLFTLATGVTVHALMYDESIGNLYLLFFALNAYFLVWRDWRHLKMRLQWLRYKKFMPDAAVGAPGAEWFDRHVTGMVGSMMANLSVVVLTLLPVQLHWLWPVALIFLSAAIALRNQGRKRRVRNAIAPILRPKFVPGKLRPVSDDENIRRAA